MKEEKYGRDQTNARLSAESQNKLMRKFWPSVITEL